MRLATIRHHGTVKVVANAGGRLIDLATPGSTPSGAIPSDLLGMLAAGTDLPALARAAAAAGPAAEVPAAEAEFLPPIPRPGKVLCLGLNYRDHAGEIGMAIPDFPIVFMRGPTSLTGHGQPILRPAVSGQLDYEAELAVVIGRTARNVRAGDAMAHVAGFSCFNDGSLRDLQFRASQWTPGKNADRTGGFGPELVTPDELPREPDALDISCRLNGETVQRSNTRQHVFGVAETIAILSSWMTLEPGDVIALGTPAGVGSARKPPLWMKEGDVCEVEIEGIGILRNPIAAGG